MRYTLGLDFGTESARSLLVDVQTGEVAGMVSMAYPDGVIDTRLPGCATPLPPDFALQNPQDWLTTLEYTVRNAVQKAKIQPEQVIGIGIDFTASTILPTQADGTPLCQTEKWAGLPQAWPKLWKHHAARDRRRQYQYNSGCVRRRDGCRGLAPEHARRTHGRSGAPTARYPTKRRRR
jgi:L-ribulokinase